METDNMDISPSEEEDDDDDDEVALSKLFSSLSGMEKYLLPHGSVTDEAIIEQSDKPISTKTVTQPDVTKNNDTSLENQTKIASETKSNSTEPHTTETKRISCDVGDNSVGTISPPVSPTYSNASTLSRQSTPEKELPHSPKDQVTITQLVDNDSDSDVIVDRIDSYRKNLENETASDHSDVTYLGTEAEIVCLGESSKDTTSRDNSDPNPVNPETVQLDDVPSLPENSQPEIESSAAPLTQVLNQSKDTENDSSVKDEDSDSSSDCLIVEHIAASDYRVNGCIDLTEPAFDDEASIALQDRTEESLLKEIAKIRHALKKHAKKKHKRGKKGKHRKSPYKKKRSKSKTRTLDKVPENENDTRIIMLTESGRLSVNIANDDPSNDPADSEDSRSTLSKTNVSVEKAPNQNCVGERLENTNVLAENEPNRNCGSEKPENTNVSSEKELNRNCVKEKSKNGESSSKENQTPRQDAADSPPLWNSDNDNNMDVSEPVKMPEKIMINPLKRKLGFNVDTNISGVPKKIVSCESGKELKSYFRRKPVPESIKRSGGRGSSSSRGKKAVPLLLDRTSIFSRSRRSPDDSDSDSRRSIAWKVSHPFHKTNTINRRQSDSDLSDTASKKSHRRELSSDKYNRLLTDSDEDIVNSSRNSPSVFDIAGKHARRSRSRSYYRSPSRSPIRYRTVNRISCGSPPRCSKSRFISRSPSVDTRLLRSKSRTYRSPSPNRSRRSRSRIYISPSRSRRSKSRTYRSPSSFRSRRSKSRTYRSPSRSRTSKSRMYRSPSRSRRSKSRTYRSPSRSRRSKSRTYRSHVHSHRSTSQTSTSPSLSHWSKSHGRRSKSRQKTPKRRSDSGSPTEIRAARKCSPLEDMRQQLKKDNEAAVRQALGDLKKPTKSGGAKACSARVIDDVDLTKSSPSPETVTESFVMNPNAPTGLTFASATAVQNEAVIQQQRPIGPPLYPVAGLRPIHPSYVRMPVPAVHSHQGVVNQMSLFQISHVYSQAVDPSLHYVPMYPPPPYM